jgi:hypothetical protein
MVRASDLFFVAHFVLVALPWDSVARAQESSTSSNIESAKTRALTMFREGRKQMALGSYDEARESFEQSKKLDPGAGTMLNLGYCYEKLGRIVQAWIEYRAAVAAARETGRPAREQEGLEQIARLDKSFGHVVIRVTQPRSMLDGFEVRLDEAALPREAWGEQVPIDVGRHEVHAKATGRKGWSESFQVTPERAADIEVPELQPETPASVAASVGEPEGKEAGRRVARGGLGGGTLRRAAVVMGGAGVAALGTGAVLGLVAKQTYDRAECPVPGHCTRSGLDMKARAYAESDIASVSAAVGGAALVGAGVLWIVSMPRRSGIRVQPEVRAASWGLSMQGLW